jgi:hypothetical protein
MTARYRPEGNREPRSLRFRSDRAGDRFKKDHTKRGTVYFGVRARVTGDGLWTPAQSQGDGLDPKNDVLTNKNLMGEKTSFLPSNPSPPSPSVCAQCRRRELRPVEVETGVCSPCKNGFGQGSQP